MKNVFQGTRKIRELHKNTFQKVAKHTDAQCLCGASLRHPRTGGKIIDGVPEQIEGQWFGQCSKECGLGGFYDLTEEDAAPIISGPDILFHPDISHPRFSQSPRIIGRRERR